jgi:DNA-binding MarR family transcriptional regulator
MALTAMQAQVLGVIGAYGPVDPPEIARHLLVDVASARSRCRSLEDRGLIGAHYTSGTRGRAYEITSDGREALRAEFGADEDGVGWEVE